MAMLDHPSGFQQPGAVRIGVYWGRRESSSADHDSSRASWVRSNGFLVFSIEHYAGAFPTWLAPVQARVHAITDKQREYVAEVVAQLKAQASALRRIFGMRKLG